jgi:multisubunit Na+/H+ antiporter MnhE subunit
MCHFPAPGPAVAGGRVAPPRSVVRRLVSFALLVLMWFGLSASASAGELIAAFAVAAAATLGHAQLSSSRGGARVRWVWRALREWPRRIISDARIVLAAVSRAPRHAGGFRIIPLDANSPAALAWSIVGTSISPNAYVVGYDRAARGMLVHELVPGQRRDDQVLWWPR